ncbi:MAG: hypothetical protein IK130_10935 [Oscillospiraceae bacterium]|nr:hypothetical protein [Oscillospiraceae bacterium]
MKDYTAFFSRALRQPMNYNADWVNSMLNAYDRLACFEDDTLDRNWFVLYETDGWVTLETYGYLSAHHPAALLTAACPPHIVRILDGLHILHTDFEEPMRCDPEILKGYAPQQRYHIFNEDEFVGGDFSEEDERFLLVLHRLQTGQKLYVDAGCFLLHEINQ